MESCYGPPNEESKRPKTVPMQGVCVTDRNRTAVRAFLCLFFLSGMTSLVYETVFTKMLSFVFGSTAYATSTVLGAFMAGLALGAWALGRIADRVARPIRLYALLEVLVAVWALCLPWMLEALEHLYVAAHQDFGASFAGVTALRFVLCFLLVLIPTVAMGGTLPVAIRALAKDVQSVGPVLSRLYGVNTFGAATGVLLAAYWVIPTLGIQGTIWLASGVNAMLAIAAFAVERRLAPIAPKQENVTTNEETKQADRGPEEEPVPLWLLQLGAFVSGFATLAYEVVWLHLLATLIGNSVYAFGIMLSTFLFGLALGGALSARYAQSTARALTVVAVTQIALGLTVLALMPLWDTLPLVFMWVGTLEPGFFLGELARFLVSSLLLVVPCTLMGMTFPLIARAIARNAGNFGKEIGRVYAINTAGAIAGSLASGFLLLGWLGSQSSILALTGVSILLGTLFLWRAPIRLKRPFRQTLATVGIAGGILGVVFLPGWDQSVIASGANVYFDGGYAHGNIVYYHEDMHGGITTVIQRENGIKTLLTNGKFQGNDSHEMKPQRQLSHMPMTLVPKADDLLVIGLGTGCTVGTFLQYGWKNIHVAELSPGIVEAAGTHFRHINDDALNNPRVTLHVTDGRNLLLLSDRRYDLIALELSSIWFAGAGNLFNREFYTIARDRMKPHGMIAQWIQVHHLEPLTILVAANTMREVFPYVSFWLVGHQGLMIGSMSPQTANMDAVRALDAIPNVKPFLQDLPLGSHVGLLGQLVFTQTEIDQAKVKLAEAGLPDTSTDDNLFLEYATPKANYLSWNFDDNIEALRTIGNNAQFLIAGGENDNAIIDAARDFAMGHYGESATKLEALGETVMAKHARKAQAEAAEESAE
jgi:spermidine synthase